MKRTLDELEISVLTANQSIDELLKSCVPQEPVQCHHASRGIVVFYDGQV